MSDEQQKEKRPLSMTRRYRRGLVIVGLLCMMVTQAGGDSVQGSPAVPVLGEISVWYQHSQCQERFKCSWGLREKRG